MAVILAGHILQSIPSFTSPYLRPHPSCPDGAPRPHFGSLPICQMLPRLFPQQTTSALSSCSNPPVAPQNESHLHVAAFRPSLCLNGSGFPLHSVPHIFPAAPQSVHCIFTHLQRDVGLEPADERSALCFAAGEPSTHSLLSRASPSCSLSWKSRIRSGDIAGPFKS